MKEIISYIINWAKKLEFDCLSRSGELLSLESLEDARKIGIRNPEIIKVSYVDQVPYPQLPIVLQVANKSGVNISNCAGIAFGNAIYILNKRKGDRHLLAHELVHVKQYQDLGFENFMKRYCYECLTTGYNNSKLEIEADTLSKFILTNN